MMLWTLLLQVFYPDVESPPFPLLMQEASIRPWKLQLVKNWHMWQNFFPSIFWALQCMKASSVEPSYIVGSTEIGRYHPEFIGYLHLLTAFKDLPYFGNYSKKLHLYSFSEAFPLSLYNKSIVKPLCSLGCNERLETCHNGTAVSREYGKYDSAAFKYHFLVTDFWTEERKTGKFVNRDHLTANANVWVDFNTSCIKVRVVHVYVWQRAHVVFYISIYMENVHTVQWTQTYLHLNTNV